jgi:hypothetical protein
MAALSRNLNAHITLVRPDTQRSVRISRAIEPLYLTSE